MQYRYVGRGASQHHPTIYIEAEALVVGAQLEAENLVPSCGILSML